VASRRSRRTESGDSRHTRPEAPARHDADPPRGDLRRGRVRSRSRRSGVPWTRGAARRRSLPRRSWAPAPARRGFEPPAPSKRPPTSTRAWFDGSGRTPRRAPPPPRAPGECGRRRRAGRSVSLSATEDGSRGRRRPGRDRPTRRAVPPAARRRSKRGAGLPRPPRDSAPTGPDHPRSGEDVPPHRPRRPESEAGEARRSHRTNRRPDCPGDAPRGRRRRSSRRGRRSRSPGPPVRTAGCVREHGRRAPTENGPSATGRPRGATRIFNTKRVDAGP
jgi:hypothetical protein